MNLEEYDLWHKGIKLGLLGTRPSITKIRVNRNYRDQIQRFLIRTLTAEVWGSASSLSLSYNSLQNKSFPLLFSFLTFIITHPQPNSPSRLFFTVTGRLLCCRSLASIFPSCLYHTLGPKHCLPFYLS